MKYQDTYFFNAQEALKVASQQNRSENGTALQVCYYEGDKIDSDLVNLVHLPVDNLVDNLAVGYYRFPNELNFDGLDLSYEIMSDISQQFKALLKSANKLRQEFNKHYSHLLKNAELDFNEPLRFWLSGHVMTNVHQHITRNIANILESMGYEVLYTLKHGCEANVNLPELVSFNPHAVIEVNYLNSKLFSDDCFHFIWLQDQLSVTSLSYKKKRDYFFHLIKGFSSFLETKGFDSIYQPFCIDTNTYTKRDTIKRENKIVFIGSSYKSFFDEVKNDQKHIICDSLLTYILKHGYIGKNKRTELNSIHNIGIDIGYIINYIERDLILKHIVNLNLDYDIEIYGHGWDNMEWAKPYYKGPLAYGEEISKVYNSAKYGLVIGGYIMQQRTLESSASGAIPLVFDSRESGDDDISLIDESVVFFKKPDNLQNILKLKHNKNLNNIVSKNSYESFVDKIINMINNNT